jgi:hypothetical protein
MDGMDSGSWLVGGFGVMSVASNTSDTKAENSDSTLDLSSRTVVLLSYTLCI